MILKKAAGALGCVVFGFGLALALLEGYYRLFDPKLYSPVAQALRAAGEAGQAADLPVRSLAGRPVLSGGVAAEDAIICLGDSFAFSLGVPDTETFDFYLQKELNGGDYFGPERVYNLGRAGSGLVVQSEAYAAVSGRLPAKTVLLVYGNNDIRQTFWEERSAVSPGRAEVRRSALARKLARLMSYIRGRKTFVPVAADPHWDAAMAAYEDRLRALSASAEARGARLALVVVDCDEVQRAALRRMLGAQGLAGHFQEFACGDEGAAYRGPDGHLNGSGNRRLAGEAARFLREEGLNG